jgi:hypothetical protein
MQLFGLEHETSVRPPTRSVGNDAVHVPFTEPPTVVEVLAEVLPVEHAAAMSATTMIEINAACR